MIEVFDRVPTLPGRVKLTREDGTEEYVTWERADDPTAIGTPINKALFDSIKEDIEARIPLTGGTATGNIVVASDTAARSFGCKVGSYDVRFMVNTNGNRGLYDNVTGEWLLKKDSSNNVTLNGTATKASTIASGALLYANCGSWSGEIAASGYTSTLTITPTSRSGYTFLGPVSLSSSSSYFCCYGLLIVSGKVQLYGRNINSKAITPTVDITGIYIKN